MKIFLENCKYHFTYCTLKALIIIIINFQQYLMELDRLPCFYDFKHINVYNGQKQFHHSFFYVWQLYAKKYICNNFYVFLKIK